MKGKNVNFLVTAVFATLSFTVNSCSDEDVFSVTPQNLKASVGMNLKDSINDGLYYYYQGKKVGLSVDKSSYYVAKIGNGDNYDVLLTSSSSSYAINGSVVNDAKTMREFTFEKKNIESSSKMTQSLLTSFVELRNNDPECCFISPCYKTNTGSEMYNSPYIYVKLKTENDTTLLRTLAAEQGISEIERVPQMALWYQLLCLYNDKTSVEIANSLFETGNFEYSTPAFIGNMDICSSDPLYADQWGVENTGQYSGKQGVDIKAKDAHSLSAGFGVNVAVVDYGVDYSHEDMISYSLGYDAYKNTVTNGSSVIYSSNSGSNKDGAHGTACAGIISANNNDKGILGVALSCQVASISLPIEIADDSHFARAISWAANNDMDVISCSWGGGLPNDILTNAINNAAKSGRNGKGCVIVFAAGNNNSSNISYPSTLENVISVGAVDMFGKRKNTSCIYEPTWGSNYGSGLDVVAPGLRISTTDITGSKGYNSGSTLNDKYNINDYTNGNYTSFFNGTSAATPFVAGVAALILERKPNLTAKEVRDIIESTCTKLPGYSFSTTLSNGTWNNEVGYGLVNAFQAVNKALMGDETYTITGEKTITNKSGTTFRVNGIPSGTSVEWSISDTVNFRISRNGYNSVMVIPNASGVSATLTAKIRSSTTVLATISTVITSLY